MKKPRKLKNTEALSLYHAVLSTAVIVPDITLALEKNGYTANVLEEGRSLLEKTRQIYDKNLVKKDELASARLGYGMKKNIKHPQVLQR